MNWQLASATALPTTQTPRRLFFFSEEFPSGARNVHHAYAPVEKLGVIFADESPTQRHLMTFCSSIVRLDEGRLRMYYTTRNRNRQEWRIAIAESADGLSWEKVSLGQEKRPGFEESVIVFANVASDPVPERSRHVTDADGQTKELSDLTRQDWVGQPQVLRLPDERWRMYYWRHNLMWGRSPYVYLVAESDDGLSWSEVNDGEPVLQAHRLADQSFLTDAERRSEEARRAEMAERRVEKARRTNDANFVYFNPWLGCYEQYSQWFLDAPPERRVDVDNCVNHSRVIQRRLSADGLTWSAPRLVIQPDSRDPWDQQFYHLAIQYHEDWLIGNLGHYRVEDGQQTMDLALAFSHDGETWHRPIRGGFIPRGPERFDSQMISPPNAWIDEGETWLCLYTGSAAKHNEGKREDLPSRRIMGARWAKNRFVGLAADDVPGGFMSDVFYPQGPEIRIDADIRGWLRAELCDAWGRKIEGFHLNDSAVIQGDDANLALSWNGASTERFIDDPVRIRFEYANGEIYNIHH